MVRHADVHNPTDIVYGRLPRFGLSELGQRQSEAVAAFLAKLRVSALYSSPQLRARQTTSILNARLGCDRIHRSALIAEVLTGHEGQPNSILAGKFNFYDNLARSSDETISMVAARMLRFLDLARRRHRGGIVIGISHADPIMILRTAVLGLPLQIDSLHGRYYPSKCSITQFSFIAGSPRPIVVYHAPVKDESNKAVPSRQASPPKVSASGRLSDARDGGQRTPWVPESDSP